MQSTLNILRKIGMKSNYTGYSYFAYGIALTVSNSAYSLNVTKGLYTDIAIQYGVSRTCVEAALRTLIRSYWNQYDDSILSELLGYPLYERPTASEFISILADFLRDNPHYC